MRTSSRLRNTSIAQRIVSVVSALALIVGAAACGSSTRTATSPTPPKCQVTLSSSSSVIGSSGGAGAVDVTTTPECTWTASSDASWISGLAPVSGQGNGRVSYQVPANTVVSSRQGDIIVNDNRVRVQQDAAACSIDITPRVQSIDAAGGTADVNVTAPSGCSWDARSLAHWISITSPPTGNGSGSVRYEVAENTGAPRTGSLSISGQMASVNQSDSSTGGPGCTYTLASTAIVIASSGGQGSIGVIASPACAWTATSNAPWISVVAISAGSGNGIVTFNVEANPGATRVGTVTVAGRTFSVTQVAVATCAYVINPTGESFGAAGGPGRGIAVSTTAGCEWASSSNASWITITGGASGSGPGNLSFSVDANSGSARAGTINVAGQTFTVTQVAAAGCSYSISPTTQGFGAGGGGGSTNVTTGPGCNWTAVSNASWISLTSSGSGTGSGSVFFDVAPNPGGARNGTLTIAGQTYTVTQSALPTCSFSITPMAQSIGAIGGAGDTIDVSTASGCTWSATSNAPWLTITSGASGSGDGAVNFLVLANAGGSRVGTLTVAGHTFTVSQASLTCSFSINPTSQSIGGGAGAGAPISVTAPSGCGWASTSNAPWLGITSGFTGTGNGTVTFSAGANPGAPRSGTLLIAGQTFTVNQANGCTYAINPTSASFGLLGGTGQVTVTAGSGCAWNVSSNAGWLDITSSASGNGNGTVNYSVGPILLGSRSGTLTIAGHTFTVNQSGLISDESTGRVKP